MSIMYKQKLGIVLKECIKHKMRTSWVIAQIHLIKLSGVMLSMKLNLITVQQMIYISLMYYRFSIISPY
jgi:hypothetical protein